MMMPGHGHGHMEHSNWRMINLPVGPLVDGKPILHALHRAFDRFFIFIT
ncbi:hypothetical protein ACP0HM_33490 [Escherichia coli]